MKNLFLTITIAFLAICLNAKETKTNDLKIDLLSNKVFEILSQKGHVSSEDETERYYVSKFKYFVVFYEGKDQYVFLIKKHLVGRGLCWKLEIINGKVFNIYTRKDFNYSGVYRIESFMETLRINKRTRIFVRTAKNLIKENISL
jgi:hypothetical protein